MSLASAARAHTADLLAAAHREAARQAEVRALRYQVNPHFLFNILNSISALVIQHNWSEAEALIGESGRFFRSSLEIDPIAFDSISRIEAYGDYVRIYSATRAYLLRQTMSAIEKRLGSTRFVRVHRSAIVRKDCIRELKHVGSGTWAAVTSDGRLTRIGRGYMSAVRQELGIAVRE